MPQSLFLFIMLYVVSFFFVLGGESWFLIWLGLELNMISFISMIYDRSLLGVEGCMKYFFIQSIGSGILLGSLYFDYFFMGDLVSMILVYKMGGGPFFFWFPALCSVISWESCFLLMTLQKVVPLMLLSFMVGRVIWVLILMSMMIGVLGAFNETNLKKLMSYSSIHHIGWIMICNYLGFGYWMFYLFMYILMMSLVITIFCLEEKLIISDLGNLKMKWGLVFGMLNLGGMPPMFGFFLKWWVFYFMSGELSLYMLLMVIMSVYMLYIYSRVVYSILLNSESLGIGVYIDKNSLSLMESSIMFSVFVGIFFFLI